MSIVSPGGLTSQKSLRLDLALNTTPLDRLKLCTESGLNDSELVSLQKGQEQLTLEQGQKIVSALKSQNVICSIDWLMEGKGLPPYLLDTLDHSELTALSQVEEQMEEIIEKEFKVLKEIKNFYQLHHQAKVCLVGGDGMEPLIRSGDYLGGVKMEKNKISQALNQICIVNTAQEHNLVRYLNRGSKPETYTLSCLNPRTTEENPILYNIEVESVAPILWIRFSSHNKNRVCIS